MSMHGKVVNSVVTFLHPVDLVLRDLTEDEVPELLRLVAEVEHLAVLAHHRQLLLAHVNDELRAQDGVVAGGDDAHLDGGARRRVHRAQVARDERVLQVLGHRVQHEHGPQPEHKKVYRVRKKLDLPGFVGF